MSTVIIHLSDIHYQRNWEENHGVVFNAFFIDLQKQLEELKPNDIYMVLSGDIVKAGHESAAYQEFASLFDLKLASINIHKSHRICVPGNHDVSTKQIENQIIDHEGVVSQLLNESRFNDYSENPSIVFRNKFSEYNKFESIFSDYSSINLPLLGNGWKISDNIGIYCLNSAFLSSGGIKSGGQQLVDKGRLAVNTRKLHVWNRECDACCKILVMHHPIEWLTDWSQKEIKALLNKDFALCLSGHAHDQSVYHSISQGQSAIHLSAPPLFTNKTDLLGYSIILLSSNHEVSTITYRQWTKNQTFLSGVDFANTDNGKIVISQPAQAIVATLHEKGAIRDVVDMYLSRKFEESLKSFSSQPRVWVEPILSKSSELERNSKPENTVTIAEIIDKPSSTIIKAPPQFGLTCLARCLALEAWRHTSASFWLCLDSRVLKPSENNIKRAASTVMDSIGLTIDDVKCVILDSVMSSEKNVHEIINSVCTIFKDIPIIVMETYDDCKILNIVDDEQYDRAFCHLYLWALSKEDIRKVVTTYNDDRHIGDADAVTTKVVTDLDALNIHRTPLNCLTVLKVSEVDFDESPVNRTEMLRRILFLLFNLDSVPTYKNRPDMKDCEYVLGYFCELMVRNDNYLFTHNFFIDSLNDFCKKRVMALDIQIVFDILYENHILIQIGTEFCFKYTYWVYYFTAQRMLHDVDFADFIFENLYYARFPEVIEFYTGIDRRREDALQVLIKDLERCNSSIHNKCGVPEEINPYKYFLWNPSPSAMEKMHSEVCNGVSASNLPSSIKDQYVDRYYDRRCPYDQEVRAILSDDSLATMMLSIRAAARALRNSDYVHPDTKRELLRRILDGWKQITQLLFVLLPLLAKQGHVTFDGISFLLAEDFGDSIDERLRNIFLHVPSNVVRWYRDDLFSQKMGPLLIEQFYSEEDDIKKHEIVLLLISLRPHDWKKAIKKYIEIVSKNSFYLFDVMNLLRHKYEYSYASPNDLKDIEYLIKMISVKHTYGVKNPGIKSINKINDSVLPKRVIL